MRTIFLKELTIPANILAHLEGVGVFTLTDWMHWTLEGHSLGEFPGVSDADRATFLDELWKAMKEEVVA